MLDRQGGDETLNSSGKCYLTTLSFGKHIYLKFLYVPVYTYSFEKVSVYVSMGHLSAFSTWLELSENQC